MESQPSVSDIVTVDPYTLTPPAALAHLHMGAPIYRAPLNQADWTPTELIRAYPEDADYFDHWKFYWLPAHQCGRPPTLPGYPLTVKPRKPDPTTPPY